MNQKRGGGNRPQNYDPKTGRYASQGLDFYLRLLTEYKPPTLQLSRKEKNKIREARKIEELDNLAKKSRDPYLFEVYKSIKSTFGNIFTGVNAKRYINKTKMYEFDILTHHHLIEIKGGNGRRCLTQFKMQQEYAKEHNKAHIVFAPNILNAVKREYTRQGITITTTIDELLNKMKEK